MTHPMHQEQPQGDPSGEAGEAAAAGEASCDWLPRVSAYHDGEPADERQAGEVTAHLAGCRACSEALAFFDRVSGAFSTAAPRRLTPQAKGRLQALVREIDAGADADPAPAPGRKLPADVRWARRLTAAAAVVFMVAAGRLVYLHNGGGRTPGGLPGGVPVSVPGRVIPDHSATPDGPQRGSGGTDATRESRGTD